MIRNIPPLYQNKSEQISSARFLDYLTFYFNA